MTVDGRNREKPKEKRPALAGNVTELGYAEIGDEAIAGDFADQHPRGVILAADAEGDVLGRKPPRLRQQGGGGGQQP